MSVGFRFLTYSASLGTAPTRSLCALSFGYESKKSAAFIQELSNAQYTAKSATVSWNIKQ